MVEGYGLVPGAAALGRTEGLPAVAGGYGVGAGPEGVDGFGGAGVVT